MAHTARSGRVCHVLALPDLGVRPADHGVLHAVERSPRRSWRCRESARIALPASSARRASIIARSPFASPCSRRAPEQPATHPGQRPEPPGCVHTAPRRAEVLEAPAPLDMPRRDFLGPDAHGGGYLLCRGALHSFSDVLDRRSFSA
jgi:hypothetical protein